VFAIKIPSQAPFDRQHFHPAAAASPTHNHLLMDSLATGAMPITSGPTALKTPCGKFDYNGSFNKAMKIHGEHQPASPPLR
jgi:hypothetical protein